MRKGFGDGVAILSLAGSLRDILAHFASAAPADFK
jgi:hypothetical protein